VDPRQRASTALLALVFLLVQIAPRLSRGVDAKHEDLSPLVAGGRLVPLFERDMPDRARLPDDRWRAVPFDDRIALQVIVKLLSRVPVPVQLLVGRNLDEVDENVAARCELRREGHLEQVRDLRAGRATQGRPDDSEDKASRECRKDRKQHP
jgi:hypothetical protein